VDTYNFDFATGAVDRGSQGGTDLTGNLRIYSSADLANLLSAANVSTELTGGVISGFTLAGSNPVAGVTLQARDFDGNILTDVFYNGLGGVPDFVATDGTADQGSFTIFNAPPGEVFLLGGAGGLGADHVGVFDQAISVKPMTVIPVVVAEVGVTGPITDWISGINVFPVEVSALGLQSDRRFSDDRGLLQLAPLVGYRVILPSDSTFTIRTETENYLPTYQRINTNLADLGSAPDLTRFLEMVSEARVDAWYRQVGLTREPGTGVLVGRFLGAQDTPQAHARYGLFDLDGNPVGSLFWGQQSLLRRGEDGWEQARHWVALNVPEGPVFIRVSAYEQVSGHDEMRVGGTVADAFPDSVTLVDVPVGGPGGDNPFLPILTRVRGRVLLPDLVTPVTDVVIDVAGFPGEGVAVPPIRSQTSFVGDEFVIRQADRRSGDPYDYLSSNLLIGSTYVFRVSDPAGQSKYVPTYQSGYTGSPQLLSNGTREVVGALQVYPRNELESEAAIAGVTLDPGAGVLVGRVLNSQSFSTADGIELKVFDQDGVEVGEMRYVDPNGLPQGLAATSSRGEFIAFNVPPGPVLVHVVSANDTGSLAGRVYPGGVTVLGDILVGDAPPEKVSVEGTVSDLAGTALGGVELTFRGQPAQSGSADSSYLTLFSDGTGSYDTNLGVVGRYIVSANAGSNYYTTHNFALSTGIYPLRGRTMYALSRSRAAQIQAAVNAAGGAVTQDPNLGIVVGAVQARSWSDDPDGNVTITDGIRGPTAIAKALLNGDGLVDLIVANGDSDTVSVYFGGLDGDFTFAGSYAVGANPVDLVGLDVDADGVGDILVLSQGSAAGEVTVLLGTVRGVFREDASRRVLVGNAPVSMALGDMDGDGIHDDLVVLNGGGGSPTLSVFYRNDQRRYVAAPYSGMLLDGSGPARLVVRDIDPPEDSGGRLNVAPPLDDVTVVMEGSDEIETYANDGDVLVRQTPLPLVSGAAPTDVVRVDVNGGAVAGVTLDLEYVVLEGGTNQVKVIHLENGLAQEIAPPVQLDAGCAPRALRLVETNGDGRADLVVPCSGNGTVTVYLGTGGGFFTPWQCDDGCPRPAVTTGTAPVSLVTDLFDAETGSDMAVVNKFSDSLSIFYGRPTPLPGVQVTVADVDGTPTPDVVYLDDAGVPLGTNATGDSGRFIAFNVPPGNAFMSATGGENANRRVVVFPGQASYAPLFVLAGSPSSVTIQGQVNDAVSSPQAGVDVEFGGTGIATTTTEALGADGVYELTLPSNQNDGVMLLRQ